MYRIRTKNNINNLSNKELLNSIRSTIGFKGGALLNNGWTKVQSVSIQAELGWIVTKHENKDYISDLLKKAAIEFSNIIEVVE